jgi:HK97 family phage prohead protease
MKTYHLICEAKVSLGQSADEAAGQPGCIEARVTTWGAREGADGRRFNYQPEGFAAWADEFSKANKPLPMFLNHNDMGMPVGEWQEFAFDKEGMTAKGKLYTNTVGGSDLYEILKESPGMFGGVSVGAYADEARYVDEDGMPMVSGDNDGDEGYFQIIKGGLREVSVVMYPNNPNAEIQKLEFQSGLTERKIERILRDAGISRKDAATASSSLKEYLTRDAKGTPENAPTQRDADAVVEAEILAALEARELMQLLNTRI